MQAQPALYHGAIGQHLMIVLTKEAWLLTSDLSVSS